MRPSSFMLSRLAALLGLLALGASGIVAQTPGGSARDSGSPAAQALLALDRYLETWNSRDAKVWATSLNFPHVRPGPGAFEVSKTAEEYAAGIDYNATLKTGWHHSEWTSRRVLQVAADKVHIAGSWQRYAEDGRPLVGSDITYVITPDRGRWGVLSRFAAGPTIDDPAQAAASAVAARSAVTEYFRAWNGHDPKALAASLHYPHVRIGDGVVSVWASAAEFLAGPEPARQRTWFETHVDALDVVQAAANGANVAITYSRRGREGQTFSAYEALVLVVRRADGWKVQAVSTMGT
jgi:hypothetical protein